MTDVCVIQHSARRHRTDTLAAMTLNQTKALAAAWTAGIGVAALFANIGSPTGWLLASIVAFGPSLTLLHFGQEPALTTSQRINNARS